jgi:hypothetical protein
VSTHRTAGNDGTTAATVEASDGCVITATESLLSSRYRSSPSTYRWLTLMLTARSL